MLTRMLGSIFQLFLILFSVSSFATEKNSAIVHLKKQPGFFRFSFDNVKMPNGMSSMGLLGLTYFADLTPSIYGGIGAYGAITGSQGGLFVLGFGGGLHHRLIQHLWGDAGLFVGGGGGRASMVGGGLMLRPYVGLQYEFPWFRVGAHYSYINFMNGHIQSSQVGLDVDFPYNFYYVPYSNVFSSFHLKNIRSVCKKYLTLQRNEFGLSLQSYFQKKGTKSVDGSIQDGTMGLVGAELDHYITERLFWSIRADGAFTGVPNGYMDVLGGVGYHASASPYFALVPQFSIGAGGGGNVDTGGGVLIHPQLGGELSLTRHFAARINGGYLWAPQGQLSAATVSGQIFYHLDLVGADEKPLLNLPEWYRAHGWRIHLFNQTYVHPERVNESTTSPDNLIAVQIDQMFTRNFFLVYQAASAYAGVHAGGFATGMIGAGLQTNELFNHHLQPFAELLIGAGGGGGLKIGGGAIIEPVLGMHFLMTPAIGLVASVGEVKALRDKLITPVVNLGLTVRFGVLEPV